MKRPLFALLLGVILIGCHQSTSSAADDPAVKKLPTTQMVIKDRTFTLEVADDPDEQQQGLMYRKSLPENEGMIFVFKDEQVRRFWMQNVPISLDIAYLDREGAVVTVLTMYPMDTRERSSEKPAQYAVEIAGGLAAKIPLKPGDVLTIPDAIKPKPASR
jgi:uncharacterized membrane protein (UPF0127 family)